MYSSFFFHQLQIAGFSFVFLSSPLICPLFSLSLFLFSFLTHNGSVNFHVANVLSGTFRRGYKAIENFLFDELIKLLWAEDDFVWLEVWLCIMLVRICYLLFFFLIKGELEER